MKHIKLFEEFVNENASPKKHLLLIWDITKDEMLPDLMLAYTSDNPKDLEMGKGELADMIEKTLKIKIDTDDFEAEIISTKDFHDDYGSNSNPNKTTLNNKDIYNI